MKYHVYLSDNLSAENVREFIYTGEKSEKDVVQAVAAYAMNIYDIDESDLDYIALGDDENSILIQCEDYHISIWINNDEPEPLNINPEYFKISSHIADIEENTPEMAAFIKQVSSIDNKNYTNE